jgi:hypothetical protein
MAMTFPKIIFQCYLSLIRFIQLTSVVKKLSAEDNAFKAKKKCSIMSYTIPR